jgi:hypothetical protein
MAIDMDFIARYRRKLLAFSDEWEKVVAKFRSGRELRHLLAGHDLTRNLVWDGIRQVSCLVGAEIARAFPVFMKAVVQFHTIAMELDGGSQMLRNICGQMQCSVLIVPFVLLDSTVAGDRTFMSTTENLAWLALESCILSILKGNPALLERIVNVGDEMKREYAGMRRQT